MRLFKRFAAICLAVLIGAASFTSCGTGESNPSDADDVTVLTDSNTSDDGDDSSEPEETTADTVADETSSENSLKIIADMIHDNPGRSDYVSAYTSPDIFIERGLNAKVFDLADAAQYGLLWPNYTVEGTDESIFNETETEWILNKREELINKYIEFKEAGLKVYFMMDMMVLPVNMSKTGLDYKTGGKIDIRKDDTKKMISDMFDEMFEVFVDEDGNSLIDGIFVRTGETYTGAKYMLPYHEGNNPLSVYTDAISDWNEANTACHTDFINILREELCVKHDKELIYRTWSFGAFHNDKNTYLSVSDNIEPHENLYFCIKYVAGDFHRNIAFNQCLNAGKHQQIVEVQSAREYEGKGAYPNYIGDGVINGFKEYEWMMQDDQNKSLSDIINTEDSLVVGVWTWSRGGGWDGPYINGTGEELDPSNALVGDYGKPGLGHEWGDELWADVNSYVIQKWAQDTTRSDKDIVLEYAREELGMDDEDADKFYELCLLSSDAVLLGRGTNTPGGSLNQFFTRDDVLDNTQGAVDDLINKMAAGTDVGNAMLEERKQSVDLWEQIIEIAQSFDDSVEKKDYMILTAKYGYYLYSLYETVFETGVYVKQVESGNTENEDKIVELINKYDQLWEDWETLYEENEDCPTLYHRTNFKAGDGVTRGSFDAVMDRYRNVYMAEPAEPMEIPETATILYENDYEGSNDDTDEWVVRNSSQDAPELYVEDGMLVVEQSEKVGSTNWYTMNLDHGEGTVYISFDIKVDNDGDNPAFFIVRGDNDENIVQVDYRKADIGVDPGDGHETGAMAAVGSVHTVELIIDVDDNTYDMNVNGREVYKDHSFRESADCVAAIQIGPFGGATQTMYIDNVIVAADKTSSAGTSEPKPQDAPPATTTYDIPSSANVVYSESFDDDGDLSNWKIRNSANSAPDIAVSDGALVVTQSSGVGTTNWYERAIDAVSGKVTVQFDMMITNTGDNPAFFIVRGKGGENIVQFDWRKSQIGFNIEGGWEGVVDAEENAYKSIKLVIDTDSKTLDMYVDGELVEQSRRFRESASEIASIQIGPFGGATQTIYVDNIAVYTE